jgi:hypothetical protein
MPAPDSAPGATTSGPSDPDASHPQPEPRPELNDYERRALEHIDHLKNPRPSRLRAALDRVQAPVTKAARTALGSRVGSVPSKAVEGLVGKLGESASWSVRSGAIYEEFRDAGFPIRDGHDIPLLQLREVDHVVGQVSAKSASLAFAEGAGAGTLGLAGLAMDIPSLVGIALRAINEYATYYGCDPSNDDERAFALRLLGAGVATTVPEKKEAMRELTKLARELGRGETHFEQHQVLDQQMITRVALKITSRLAAPKTVQIIPVTGSVVGAAANAWFVGTVARTAHPIYRERFLIAKHGPDVAVPVRG